MSNKWLLVTDTHAGVRNENEIFFEYQKRLWVKFFTYAKENGIIRVMHLGDFFDRRTHVHLKTLSFVRWFETKAREAEIKEIVIIPGNHDILHRNTNEINSPEYCLDPDLFRIVNTPTEIEECVLIPWVNNSNLNEILDVLKTSKKQWCMGHFDIVGCMMHPGTYSEHGLDPSVFKKFHGVFSGHYHSPSKKGNIQYLGSPFELTWNDFNDKKFFYVFDMEHGIIESIQNEESLFFKYNYGKETLPYQVKSFGGKFLKVYCDTKEELSNAKLWLLSLSPELQPYDVQIIDRSYFDEQAEKVMDVAESHKSDTDLFREYVESYTELSDEDKGKVTTSLEKLYSEAMNA